MGCIHSTSRTPDLLQARQQDVISQAFRQTCRCRVDANRLLNQLEQHRDQLRGSYLILRRNVEKVCQALAHVYEASDAELADYMLCLNAVNQDFNAIMYGDYDPERFFDQSRPSTPTSPFYHRPR